MLCVKREGVVGSCHGSEIRGVIVFNLNIICLHVTYESLEEI